MNASPLNLILYVEDDPVIRTVVQIALGEVGGYSLHDYGLGREALAAVKSGLKPDLIVLDVMMPEMDGPATLAELRKLPSTAVTPVVFMTAKVQASEVAYYYSLGAIGVIAKPFDPMLLAQQVQEIWDKSGDRR